MILEFFDCDHDVIGNKYSRKLKKNFEKNTVFVKTKCSVAYENINCCTSLYHASII